MIDAILDPAAITCAGICIVLLVDAKQRMMLDDDYVMISVHHIVGLELIISTALGAVFSDDYLTYYYITLGFFMVSVGYWVMCQMHFLAHKIRMLYNFGAVYYALAAISHFKIGDNVLDQVLLYVMYPLTFLIVLYTLGIDLDRIIRDKFMGSRKRGVHHRGNTVRSNSMFGDKI